MDDSRRVASMQRRVAHPRLRAPYALRHGHVQVEGQRVGARLARQRQPRGALAHVKVAAVDHDVAAGYEGGRTGLLTGVPVTQRVLCGRTPALLLPSAPLAGLLQQNKQQRTPAFVAELPPGAPAQAVAGVMKI